MGVRVTCWLAPIVFFIGCASEPVGHVSEEPLATRVVRAGDEYRIESAGRSFATFSLPVLADLGSPEVEVDAPT